MARSRANKGDATRGRASASEARASSTSSAAGGPGLRSIPGYLGDKGPPAVDRLIHERMRLGVMSALAVNDSLSFNELKKLLKATDGNLSVHARKLEEAGYIRCEKRFEGRLPHTEYALTDAGRTALERYLAHMEALIEAMRR